MEAPPAAEAKEGMEKGNGAITCCDGGLLGAIARCDGGLRGCAIGRCNGDGLRRCAIGRCNFSLAAWVAALFAIVTGP